MMTRSTYNKDKQWHRVVPVADGFDRLERFLEQLHWFDVNYNFR